MLDHERLDVYQAAIQFLALAHRILAHLPRGHATIADQLQRAVLSIPVNIGEGTGKRSPKDRARFYEYSRGSAMECGALFDALRIMELIDEETHAKGKELLVRIVSMLSKMC
jgi:four helix bundle protein